MGKILKKFSKSVFIIFLMLPTFSYAATPLRFNLFPDLRNCTNENALACWTGYVFNWSQGAILLLSVGAFIAAGLIYMTSTGNPKQILLAKKLIYGALSAIGVIVLGRFFLVNIVGVPWL